MLQSRKFDFPFPLKLKVCQDQSKVDDDMILRSVYILVSSEDSEDGILIRGVECNIPYY
uniref:Uncharacterized protein n=1 Tax=Daucus carota subsp. sativus TaxID=79200 RepID=A0A162AIS3_DAUCS